MAERVRKLRLILCWHMHQPDYRNYSSGEFTLPWTYLHALKDYSDMAFHMEQHPGARAVFNFVPVLLDQLEAYGKGFEIGEVRDPLLRLLAAEDLDRVTEDERALILEYCFRCNHQTMLLPYPAFKRLHDLYNLLEGQDGAALGYLSGKYLADLLVWYHLAWMGESVRRQHERVTGLLSKGEGYTYADRLQLFHLIGELIGELIPRYRRLAEAGRIELSTTPHYHPIAPLLIDLKAARESLPDSTLPQSPEYPGGRTRVAFHITSALESHRARFGAEPHGFWPAEGGVSSALMELLAQQGCRWTASGEGVLVNSLRRAQPSGALPSRAQYLYRPYRIAAVHEPIVCFFRDDRLSDLIGFEYAKWHGRDAAANFVRSLEQILQEAPMDEDPVVSVILDGENAWEFYPYNGYYFLSDLYDALQAHPAIEMTTFREVLEQYAGERGACAKPGVLPGLVAGSWVYGTFSTWIGSPDKDRAWDLLCAAKQSFDRVMASGRLTEAEQAAAYRQLSSCESSDWFWWFGDYNSEHGVTSFDRLFRENLSNLYRLLHLAVPEHLSQPISRGGGHAEAGGTMRRAG